MVLFSLKLDNTPAAKRYVDTLHKNIRVEDPIRNPFYGDWKIILKDKSSLYVLTLIQPIYPNLFYIFWLIAAGIYVVWGRTWWLLLPCIFGMVSLFYTKWPYYFGFKLGMKKAKYTGTVKLIPLEELIKSIHFR